MNRRFAIIQALVSVVALAAVVVWASNQESPHIPTDGQAIAWLLAALGLYVLATLVRAERWHQILVATGVHCHACGLLRAHHGRLHGQQRAPGARR